MRLRSGLDLDVGIGSRRWAATMPVDRGTARVVQEGWRIIHDPEGALVKLELAVRSAEQG